MLAELGVGAEVSELWLSELSCCDRRVITISELAGNNISAILFAFPKLAWRVWEYLLNTFHH